MSFTGAQVVKRSLHGTVSDVKIILVAKSMICYLLQLPNSPEFPEQDNIVRTFCPLLFIQWPQ